jgi:hypothetical protein
VLKRSESFQIVIIKYLNGQTFWLISSLKNHLIAAFGAGEAPHHFDVQA